MDLLYGYPFIEKWMRKGADEEFLAAASERFLINLHSEFGVMNEQDW
jgi:hypothetical protein